jgi:hypothetical protein
MIPVQRSMPDMLVLRLRTSSAPSPPAEPTAKGDDAIAKTSATAKAFAALNPAARQVVMQLRRGDDVLGEWRFTLKDLNVPLDPEALLQLQERFSAPLQAINRFASEQARALSNFAPWVLKHTTLDDLRRLVSKPSLPLPIAEDLRDILNPNVARHNVVWVELVEPLGFLPLLPWEAILSEAIAAPILRLTGHLLDAASPKKTADVMVVCTTGHSKTRISGRTVAALCRQVLDALPAPHRCVIHVFADEDHRADVAKAFASAKLPTFGDGSPSPRGVVLYELPAEQARSGDEQNPWARWIRTVLRGKGIDVIHVLTDGGFPGLRPSLRVSPTPWTASSDAVLEGNAAPPPVRYVGPTEMAEFSATFGAWAVVFSGLTMTAQRAQRLLSFDLARTRPGVFTVHDMAADTGMTACGALYRFLTGIDEDLRAALAALDLRFLSVQCHPSRINPALGRAWLEEKLGAEFANASESVRVSLEQRPDATPAWLGVAQRQIEQSVNTNLTQDVSSASDRAAQESVASALKVVMDIVARYSKQQS